MKDEEIIRLYFQRSETAISETEKKYGKLCSCIARNILRDELDVDECVNDTYLGAWDSIPPAKPVFLSAYLGRITKNLAWKKYEYLTAKKRNPEVMLSFSELEECVTDVNSKEIRYSDGELRDIMNRFLHSQKAENRMVFVQRYWYCMSVKEICKQYHMSKSKVESILFRVRKNLRRVLEEEGYDI